MKIKPHFISNRLPYVRICFSDHGRRSWGGGGQVSQNLEWGDRRPRFCQILSTRLLALQCRKMCFCLYRRTFIVSPAMRPPRIPVRSTPMLMTEQKYTCMCEYFVGNSPANIFYSMLKFMIMISSISKGGLLISIVFLISSL